MTAPLECVVVRALPLRRVHANGCLHARWPDRSGGVLDNVLAAVDALGIGLLPLADLSATTCFDARDGAEAGAGPRLQRVRASTGAGRPRRLGPRRAGCQVVHEAREQMLQEDLEGCDAREDDGELDLNLGPDDHANNFPCWV